MDNSTITNLVFFVLSGVLAVALYILSIRSKAPYYSLLGRALSDDNLVRLGQGKEKLEVSFTSKAQSSRPWFVTQVLIWNHGYDALREDDIVDSNPPRITWSRGTQVLDARIVKTNNRYSDAHLTLERRARRAVISFNYLNRNDGMLIQLIHDATVSRDINISGSFRGATLRRYNPWRRYLFTDPLGVGATGIYMATTTALLNLLRDYLHRTTIPFPIQFLLVGIGGCIVVWCLILLWLRDSIPAEFDEFARIPYFLANYPFQKR